MKLCTFIGDEHTFIINVSIDDFGSNKSEFVMPWDLPKKTSSVIQVPWPCITIRDLTSTQLIQDETHACIDPQISLI